MCIRDRYARLPEVADIGIRGGKKLREKLEAAKDDVLLFRSITAISLEAPLSVHHDLLVPGAIDISGITNFCDRMNFGNRIRDRVRQLSEI